MALEWEQSVPIQARQLVFILYKNNHKSNKILSFSHIMSIVNYKNNNK
jgi:hypothetical protein